VRTTNCIQLLLFWRLFVTPAKAGAESIKYAAAKIVRLLDAGFMPGMTKAKI